MENGGACPVMVVGQDRLAYSVVCGLLVGGYPVLLKTINPKAAEDFILDEVGDHKNLNIITDWQEDIKAGLVVLVTDDKLDTKQNWIDQLEKNVSEDAIIAVNLESICLEELQTTSVHPSRILGLNWAYPVHQTFFAEIISNADTDLHALEQLESWVKEYWKKDPCIAKNGFSVRARMMAAMFREGLYLVENGFASIESVDRACRNDAGYYLPFAGNFRYMDLMGTYAYGMVMKDLNKELSNMNRLPKILQEKKYNGETGMDKGKGFYRYSDEEKAYWERVVKTFSKEIQQLIKKYPHESFDH